MGFILGNSWYISAMFLAMFILYPLVSNKWKQFIEYYGPLLVIFIMGYFVQNIGYFENWATWHNIVFSGLLRAIAEISLGCICYEISNILKIKKLTVLSHHLLSLVEIFIFIGIIVASNYKTKSYWDFIFCFLLAIAIVIVLSEQASFSKLFIGNYGKTLADFSLSLYVSHSIVYFIFSKTLLNRISYWQELPIYYICCILLAICCLKFSLLLLKLKPVMKKLFIYSKEG